MPAARHRLETMDVKQNAEMNVGYALHCLQHSFHNKGVMTKLEEELRVTKEKLNKGLAEIKFKVDEERKKALEDQKVKLELDHSLMLNAAVKVAIERESARVEAQLNNLEDDKLELEAKCQTLEEELTDLKKKYDVMEDEAKDSISWVIENSKAKLACMGCILKEGIFDAMQGYM